MSDLTIKDREILWHLRDAQKDLEAAWAMMQYNYPSYMITGSHTHHAQARSHLNTLKRRIVEYRTKLENLSTEQIDKIIEELK